MKKLLFAIAIFCLPYTAFAYTVTTNSGTAGTTAWADGGANAGELIGTFFTTVGAGVLQTVSICNAVQSTGSQTATYTLSLEGDNSGKPNNTVIASVGAVATSWATYSGGNGGYHTLTFSSPPSVSASTKYWLVFSDSAYQEANGPVACGVSSGSGTIGSSNTTAWDQAANHSTTGLTATIGAASSPPPPLNPFLMFWGKW